MRFMHLADLHIGKVVCGFSMLEDQAYILDQITGHVRAQRPDAIVIAGDVYDKPAPGTDAVALLDAFLTSLSALEVPVLIIGGNHDAHERLGFAREIIARQGIYICGPLTHPLMRVRLEDGHGPVVFTLLPFIRPLQARKLYDDAAIETYHDAVAAVLRENPMDTNVRNVLVAHQFFVSAQAEMERSDSEVGPVGGIDSVHASLLSGYDYVALGHLHGPQKAGGEHIRYAGSPLKYSVSEWRQQKSVPLVTLDAKGEAQVQCLPLKPLRDLRRVTGHLDAICENERCHDYIHVTLTNDEAVHDALGKLRDVYPNLLGLAFDNRRTAADDLTEGAPMPEKMDAFALFEAFFAQQNGMPMTESQATAAQRFLEDVEGRT